MSGKLRNIDAVQIGQQIAMAAIASLDSLAGVGTYQKGSPATGRIQDLGVTTQNTKAVDQIHHLHPGVELAILVTLFWPDQALEDAANHFIVELGKIELVNLGDQAAPALNGRIGIERNPPSHIFRVIAKDGFVVTGNLLCFGEKML